LQCPGVLLVVLEDSAGQAHRPRPTAHGTRPRRDGGTLWGPALSQIARQLPQSRCHWLLGVPVARASSRSCSTSCSDSDSESHIRVTNITVTVTLPIMMTLMACAIGFKFSLPVEQSRFGSGGRELSGSRFKLARRPKSGHAQDWTREKHKPNPHMPYEQAGWVEWGVLVTRTELLKFLPFGLAATHASRAGGSTGYFGRESMLCICIDGPSRAVRYSSRAARPGCPCPAASIFPIKFGLVNELK
jgi:hypothetical protein